MKILLTTFFLIFALFASDNSHARPNLFGKKEERNRDIDEFPKWTRALDKTMEEFNVYSDKCAKGSKIFYCNIKEWRAFIDSLQNRPRAEQVSEVNKYLNKHKYILDINNWGVTDYWASPGEFLFKNGDCEDYAIIKYFSLKQLGFDANDLRIVVLMDNNLGIYHSVLATYVDNDIYIMDNQIANATKSTNILHYNPVYSINEENWWRYF